MLFSGLGDKAKAQESLSVGVGALAGSTIMLLTVPWGLSILAGRVNIVRGQCTYKKTSEGEWLSEEPGTGTLIVINVLT